MASGSATDDDPAIFQEQRMIKKSAQLNEEIIRESRRRYYGLISQIDYELGRFMGELRTKGLYDDTAIIFNSDHGEHLGDHGLWGKTTFLAGSADVPTIVRVPAWMPMARPTQEIDSPVLTADLYPTVLDMAGVARSTTSTACRCCRRLPRGGTSSASSAASMESRKTP